MQVELESFFFLDQNVVPTLAYEVEELVCTSHRAACTPCEDSSVAEYVV